MTLTETEKRRLRGLAHHLSPYVHVGNAGITPGVLAELDGALAHHELLKIKVRADDRAQRNAVIAELALRCDAAVVTRIGNVAVLYRPATDAPGRVMPGTSAA
ncbi:RNA-binding protein [Gammaproteobacteria bacterium]|nr:ribosome assembly RNA-binding protein YhbY [Gammaproteobacteria bacterium]QOJ31644.1 MAG: ribosome assembly RNA-binding protein YhbY [Gammaproteobacteria bacterium]CAG0942099.1 RNA-binding protein [Gammaproteobacteria bacterium]